MRETFLLVFLLLTGCTKSYVYLFRPVGPRQPAYNLGQMPSDTSGAVAHPNVDWNKTPGPPLALVTPEHAQERPANELLYRLDLRHRFGYKVKRTCMKNEKCRKAVQCYYNNKFVWCP